MTTKTLAQQLDKTAFDLISKHHPQVIKQINAMLDQGATAKQIEKRLQRYSTHVTANLIVCAAHYLEAQRKANPQ